MPLGLVLSCIAYSCAGATTHCCCVGCYMESTGHTDEVNAIKWDPSGQLLASCSDDYTAKVSVLFRYSVFFYRIHIPGSYQYTIPGRWYS